MIYLCFVFFLTGFILITIGTVAMVLRAINTGAWPKLQHPRYWDASLKKICLGILLVLAGIMTGYAI